MARAPLPFDQHLHSPVGEAQKLDDRADRPDGEDVLGDRLVGLRLALRGEEDLLAAGGSGRTTFAHRLFERADRLFTTDEERHHHVREDDDVPQRKQWYATGPLFLVVAVGHAQPAIVAPPGGGSQIRTCLRCRSVFAAAGAGPAPAGLGPELRPSCGSARAGGRSRRSSSGRRLVDLVARRHGAGVVVDVLRLGRLLEVDHDRLGSGRAPGPAPSRRVPPARAPCIEVAGDGAGRHQRQPPEARARRSSRGRPPRTAVASRRPSGWNARCRSTRPKTGQKAAPSGRACESLRAA